MAQINPINLHDRKAARGAGAAGANLRLPPQARNEPVLFAKFELQPQPRKTRFVLSVVLHTAALALLVEIVALLASPRVEPAAYARVTPLIAPVPPAIVKKRVTIPPTPVVAKLETFKPVIAPPPPPKPVEVVKATPSVIHPKEWDAPVVAEIKPIPAKKVVLNNVLASGSSAAPTLQKPPRLVQTGGFGDPQGVRGTSDKGQLRAAALGSFDLPAGQGNGNGTAGSRGVKGTVASAGFGDGVAGPGSGDHGRKGQVAQAGFDQVAGASPSSKPKAEAKPDLTPVEILYKPRPVYTDEARKLHVEGEVLMEVTFSAAGSLQDMRVVRGLGHGLDEAARRAAAQIKFRPAKRAGQPVDSVAVVHIVFELAE
ncbi:MAG TPA: energy transducer TonB [Verrucomicrobiae bacterium]|nr:energy transducer TonB [Verrucomicrobiae bacterium]